MKNRYLNTVLSLLATLAFQFVSAQNISDYEKMLTDDSFQEWTLGGTQIHLSGNCTDGIKLKFLKENKEVVRKECVENEWKLDTYNWVIRQDGTQLLLIFGKYTFEIDFLSNSTIENPDGTNIKMRLRQTLIDGKVSKNRVSPDKKIEVTDLFFNKV